MTRERPVILTLCDYYLPGYKAGGPVQTLAGIVEQLGDEFRMRLVTRDRDLGDTESYPATQVNTWQTHGKADVIYLSPDRLTLGQVRRLLSATDHDVLYINSFFSIPFGILPLLLRRSGLIPRRAVIVAPRGELAVGALAIHPGKKRLYIEAARMLGLTRSALWQASGPHEEQDIRRSFGAEARVIVAADLPPAQGTAPARRADKRPGQLRLLFLGRISRMKNLDGALTLLHGIRGPVQLDIYGPIEDPDYWKHCQELMGNLPANVRAGYGGALSHDRVGEVVVDHDLLFLPSLGENFGHVILEAMAVGTPVLISDRTPWRDLSAVGVGWDVPLEEPQRFREVLDLCLEMDAAAWRGLSERAKEYGVQHLNDPGAREQNRALFRAACQLEPGRSHPTT